MSHVRKISVIILFSTVAALPASSNYTQYKKVMNIIDNRGNTYSFKLLEDTFKHAFNNAEFKKRAKAAKRPISYLSAEKTRELCTNKLGVYKSYEDVIGPVVKGK